MTLGAALSAAFGGLSVWALLRRPGSRTRLRQALSAGDGPAGRGRTHGPAAHNGAHPAGRGRARGRARGQAAPHGPPAGSRVAALGPTSACALAAVGLALVVPAPAGLVLGAAVLLIGPRSLAGLEPRSARQEAVQLAQDLPLALDLLAACLSGGASLDPALRAVCSALPGPCGSRFGQVAAALALGSPAAEAWAALGTGSPVAAAAARTLVRAAQGGAPVAAAVTRVATDARAEQAARATLAARRAGVLAVGPLGLCFLPAFVLLGVVPAVVGLATPLLASL